MLFVSSKYFFYSSVDKCAEISGNNTHILCESSHEERRILCLNQNDELVCNGQYDCIDSDDEIVFDCSSYYCSP